MPIIWMLWLMETPLLRRRYTGGLATPLLRNCGGEVGAQRGAEEAGGHVAALARIRQRAGAYRTGILSGDIVEDASEGAEAAPTGVEGNGGDGQVGIAQQRRGAFDATRKQVAMRRYAEGLPEGACEMRSGDPTDPGQPRHRPVFMRSHVHAVLRAQQATQQLRRLDHGSAARAIGRCAGGS
jgi:hypothetical protein